VRSVTPDEEQAWQRIAKATSERVDVVKCTRTLLGVRAGQAYTHAAREATYTPAQRERILAELQRMPDRR
jgi:hypothetical protein